MKRNLAGGVLTTDTVLLLFVIVNAKMVSRNEEIERPSRRITVTIPVIMTLIGEIAIIRIFRLSPKNQIEQTTDPL